MCSMKIDKFKKDMEVYSHLYDLGCRVIKEEVKENNYVADYVGYVIGEQKNIEPKVIVEVKAKEEMSFKTQKQLFKTAEKFDVPYALLILINDAKVQRHWFDTQTSLPVEPPKFKDYSEYISNPKEIKHQIWK